MTAPLLALLAVLAAPVRCVSVPAGCFAYQPACTISACACPVQCGRFVHPVWVRGRVCECG